MINQNIDEKNIKIIKRELYAKGSLLWIPKSRFGKNYDFSVREYSFLIENITKIIWGYLKQSQEYGKFEYNPLIEINRETSGLNFSNDDQTLKVNIYYNPPIISTRLPIIEKRILENPFGEYNIINIEVPHYIKPASINLEIIIERYLPKKLYKKLEKIASYACKYSDKL